jgi:hypothetical protein
MFTRESCYPLETGPSPASTCSTSAARTVPSSEASFSNPRTNAPAVAPRASQDPHPHSSSPGEGAATNAKESRQHADRRPRAPVVHVRSPCPSGLACAAGCAAWQSPRGRSPARAGDAPGERLLSRTSCYSLEAGSVSTSRIPRRRGLPSKPSRAQLRRRDPSAAPLPEFAGTREPGFPTSRGRVAAAREEC